MPTETHVERGHMLKWDAENQDYEIVHAHTCPVMWYFRSSTAIPIGDVHEGEHFSLQQVEYVERFSPGWEYQCGVDYEVSHVGLASVEDMPDASGTYELTWECEGGGDDFDSWLSIGEKVSDA